ncbi:amidohydrolase [Pseudozobellia thermophila]|uniref:Omega-amidase YafV n=1 Tax=Pseudozobellia thermophila TaxID=192903 RepID=A0A1M6ASR4_9FLAO|nr:amidohydrolase [Pseudozobellia thermophila]SHI39477.1 Carbon-nitrogen hydrolase [Pseudozobellia thermophila]
MNDRLNIALVQTPLVWEDPEANRSRIGKKLDALAPNVDLIVLPEMFTTGFTMSPGNIKADDGRTTIEWMGQWAEKKGAALVGSIANNSQGVYTNRLFFVPPAGEVRFYDKRHTFTLAGEDRVYQSGKKRLTVTYRGFRICPMICYDLRFPVWARNTDDYDLLLYVANWPKARIDAWDALLKARAIENVAYCVGANRIGTDENGHVYNGHSAAYDCLGEQIAFSDREEIIYATLYKDHIAQTRNKLKFLQDRDRFNLEW